MGYGYRFINYNISTNNATSHSNQLNLTTLTSDMSKNYILPIFLFIFLNNVNAQKTLNWYEGGTLHKSKISEWKDSTDRNKLATCADFMASRDNTVSMKILKRRSMDLKNCIDEATRGLKSTNDESVSTIAALCVITLRY